MANEIRIKVSADTRAAEKSIDGVGKSAEGVTAKMRNMRGGILKGTAVIGGMGIAAGLAAKSLVGSAAKLDLMNNKIDIVFGDEGARVRSWAKEVGGSMGLTSTNTASLAAGFADLLIPMGFAREEAATMAMDVVGLSGALSEWSGGQQTAAEVSDILAKAMLGETEGLKTLGISIKQADIAAQLAVNGTQNLTGAALEQAKAVATQELIMLKSVDAQTAFAEGADSLARKQSELGAKFAEVKDKIVIGLTPAIMGLMEFFVDMPTPVLIAVGALAAVTTAMALMVIGIPFLVAALGGVATALGAITTAAGFTWAALTGPIGLVIIAVALLGAAIWYFRDDLKGALDSALGVAERVLGWISEHFDKLLSLIPGFGPVLLLFKDHFRNVFDKVVGFVQPLIDKLNALRGVLTFLVGKVKDVGGAIKDAVTESVKMEYTADSISLEMELLAEANYQAEQAVLAFAAAEKLAAEEALKEADAIAAARQEMIEAAEAADRISARQLARELATDIVRAQIFSGADFAARQARITTKLAEEKEITALTDLLLGKKMVSAGDVTKASMIALGAMMPLSGPPVTVTSTGGAVPADWLTKISPGQMGAAQASMVVNNYSILPPDDSVAAGTMVVDLTKEAGRWNGDPMAMPEVGPTR